MSMSEQEKCPRCDSSYPESCGCEAARLREALREARALWPYDDERKLTAILDRALGDTPDE
jgi:hypothetical protein